MPRTKRPVRKQEMTVEDDDALKKIDKIVLDQKNKIDKRVHSEQQNIELAFKILLGSLNAQYLNKTVGQLKSELHLEEPVASKSVRSTRRGTSQDDGYHTQNSSQGSDGKTTKKILGPPSCSRPVGRRSRSADASARSVQAARSTAQRRRSRSVYKTPAYNRKASLIYPTITPKVTPHAPFRLLRTVRNGETVVSLSGSPVMVPSYNTLQTDDKANCNILLRDGTLLALQPKELRESEDHIPVSLMDFSVLQQLRTLKNNLEKVVKLGEKTMK